MKELYETSKRYMATVHRDMTILDKELAGISKDIKGGAERVEKVVDAAHVDLLVKEQVGASYH